MEPDLRRYLTGDFAKAKDRMNQMRLLLQQSAQLFAQVYDRVAEYQVGFPYAWIPGTDNDPVIRDLIRRQAANDMSVSTQAMCCAGIQSLLSANDGHSVLSSAIKAKLELALSQITSTVFTYIDANLKANKSAWKSSTFGADDIFTASWLLPLVLRGPRCPPNVSDKVISILATAAVRSETVDQFEKSLFHTDDIDDVGPHPLPLVWAASSIRQILKLPNGHDLLRKAGCDHEPQSFFAHAGRWFERNLHRQMSFSRFRDFRFDAAELVFCLYGGLVTRTLSKQDMTIPDVLEIVREAQERSVYWRPYRPMKSTSQGGVLLPLSIEVASSLLATLTETRTFHQYQQTLEHYYEWLVSQRVVQNDLNADSESEPAGWHSENVYETKQIHVWDTARVVMFLCSYWKELETETQDEILRVSRFAVYKSDSIHESIDSMVPFDYGANGDISTKLKLVASASETSVLLAGPPGVSKTTMAMAIAKEKGAALVYLTPSDFITGGESVLELTTKTIFDALTELHNVVIFFDEIDRMILDRDSEAYGKQGDIFQFMTPAMLPKLTRLRKEGRCTFVIATNYAERIDPAIKRGGRIDQNILCLPFNLAARRELIRRLWGQAWERRKGKTGTFSLGREAELVIEQLARRTPLHVYESLKKLVHDALDDIRSDGAEEFVSAATAKLGSVQPGPSEIRLRSYDSRFDPKAPQWPAEEFLRLCLLKGEVNPEDEDAKGRFGDIASKWRTKNPEEYGAIMPSIRAEMVKCDLASWEVP